MAGRMRKVRAQSAATARDAAALLPVSPGDMARLRSRWPWVRWGALRRVEGADPLASDRRCFDLIIGSLASPWTRNAARRVLAAWLQDVPNQACPRLDNRQLAVLRDAVRHSLPYRHASFVIAALGALARLEDVEARSVAAQFLADAVESPASAPPPEPWAGFPETYRGAFGQASHPGVADTLREVRRAAAACLRRLERAQERLQRRGMLVAPADAPTDVLLRPAEGGNLPDDPNLLRPASPAEPRKQQSEDNE